jgi:hypothetical protein
LGIRHCQAVVNRLFSAATVVTRRDADATDFPVDVLAQVWFKLCKFSVDIDLILGTTFMIWELWQNKAGKVSEFDSKSSYYAEINT